jgi:hypothetical protein
MSILSGENRKMKALPCVDCLVFVRCKVRASKAEAPRLYYIVKDLVVTCDILKNHFLEHPSTEIRDGVIAVIRWGHHRLTNEVISVFDLKRESDHYDTTTYIDIRDGKQHTLR